MHWTLARRTAGLLDRRRRSRRARRGGSHRDLHAGLRLGVRVARHHGHRRSRVAAAGHDRAPESGFAINVWGNWDWTDDNGLEHEFIEVDLTPSYTFDTGSDFTAAVGLIEYVFPNSGAFNDATTEAWFSLGWNGTITPALAVYYDFDAVEDYYANLSLDLAHEFADDDHLQARGSRGLCG